MLGIVDRIMIGLHKREFINNKRDFSFKKYFFERSGKIVWICFLPKKTDLRIMKKYNLIPRRNTVLVYGVPDAFLSPSPDVVLEAFEKLRKDFLKQCESMDLKNKKVFFAGLSVGNMPAFYFANRVKSKKLIAVCPTDKLGDGIFEALAAEQMKIKKGAIARGYTAEKYDEVMKELNPINNTKNLPQNIEVYLARFDKYVSYVGGKRLVSGIKQCNKKVKVRKFNFFGHFMTMVMFGLKNRD